MKRKKTILWVLAGLLAMALLFCGIYHRSIALSLENLTVEHYGDPAVDPWDGGKAMLNIPYASVSESDYLNLYLPDGVENPQLFVLIHGGGFIAGTAETRQTQLMYRFFRDRGYAVATVNYRLAQEAPFPAAIEDCKAAIRFLRANAENYGYNAERIALFGESAGGYLASMCAFTNDGEFNDLPFIGQTGENDPGAGVDVLVDYYPFVSLTGLDGDLKEIGCAKLFFKLANSWVNGALDGYEDFASYWLRKNISEMSPEEREAADPFWYLEKNGAELQDLAVWLIHGEADITVPIPSSNRLYADMQKVLDPGRLVYRVVPHMGHASDPLYADAILEEIEAWMAEQLDR